MVLNHKAARGLTTAAATRTNHSCVSVFPLSVSYRSSCLSNLMTFKGLGHHRQCPRCRNKDVSFPLALQEMQPSPHLDHGKRVHISLLKWRQRKPTTALPQLGAAELASDITTTFLIRSATLIQQPDCPYVLFLLNHFLVHLFLFQLYLFLPFVRHRKVSLQQCISGLRRPLPASTVIASP